MHVLSVSNIVIGANWGGYLGSVNVLLHLLLDLHALVIADADCRR